jgi:hypothetical protein
MAHIGIKTNDAMVLAVPKRRWPFYGGADWENAALGSL